MSRRKQARPKSCKLEGMVDKREDEPSSSSLRDLSVPSTSSEWAQDCSSDKGDRMTPGQETGDMQVKTDPGEQGGGESSGDGGASSPVFRCDACSAVFDTLDHFMDHRNFTCTASSDTGMVWTSSEDKPEGNSSESGLGSPPPPSLEEGVLSPLPLHLSEDQLPFAIGISEANPYGCQFCEKAFPQTSYLVVHERVHSDQLPYSCDHCQRLFREKRHRDRHLKLHASERKLKCAQCDAVFDKKEALKAHTQRKHGAASKPYQCPLCPSVSFSSAVELTRHLVSHKDLESSMPLPLTDPLACSQCGQSFETMQLLQEHTSIHSAVIKVEKLSCEVCGQQFTSQDALDTHMEHLHYRSPNPLDLDPTALLLKCPMCSLDFADTMSLCHHLMTHTATSLTLTTDLDHAALVRGGKDMLVTSPKKDLSRSHTPKRSASAAELSPGGSRLPKTPQQALVCPYCLSDSFDSLEVLELHMQSVHSVKSNEIYTCNYCNAPYPNLYSLHDHMNVVHRNHPGIGIKYPCSLCNNQFPSIEALAKHKSLSHSYPDSNDGGGAHSSSSSSGIDSAFCGQCTLTFPTARQLEDHMVSVHGAAVEKKPGRTRGRKPANKGNKENKQTKTKLRQAASSTAASSVTDSTPATSAAAAASFARALPPPPPATDSITCDECNATFHELANFQAHMKLHLDAALAKFTCKKCGQQLGSQEQLEAHLSLHYLCLATEYGCTSCMKLFSKPDELQKHLMDIHAHHLYRCALCKEIFDSKVNIQVHFAIKHSNECKLFKCTQCPNIFRSEMEWQVHVRVNHLHLAKPYRCLFCAESFTSEMELQCHLTTHSKPFRCPMCEQAFHIEYLLDQHLQTEHADSDTKAAVAALLSPVPGNVSIKEEADSSTSVVSSLSLSLTRSPRPSSRSSDARKSVSPAVPQPSLSPVALSALSSAVWKNSEAVHMCNICDSRFTQPSLLAIHKAQEHGLKMGGNSLSPTGKGRSASVSPCGSFSVPASQSQSQPQSQATRERFLQQNQTLVSVLTADAQSSHQMACTFCSQTFRNQTECDKHMKIHANSTSLKCNICDETFPSWSTLAEHKLQHCKIQQGNVCFVCKLTLKTEEQFYSHAQEHGYQGSLLQCIVCRQTLASVVELQMHGKHHYQLRPSFYTCCVCLKTFHSKENLVSKLNASGRTYYVCKPCYHGESPLHTCPQCSEKFASKAQLDAHAATHSASASPPKGSSSVSSSPQTYQCIKCQESFGTEYEIQLHVANHMLQEGTTHECKLCTLVFESPAKLQCHLIEHTYRNQAEIGCRVCGKTFGSAAEIQVHALEHGVQGRRNMCGQCSQSFFFSAELENHALIYNHSPATPSGVGSPQRLECHECSKVFTSRAALSSHRAKHHDGGDTGLRCSLCSQTFGSVVRMQQHFLLFHMGGGEAVGMGVGGDKSGSHGETHSCPQCKQQFASAESLQVHVSTAHKSGGGGQVSCPICSKTFSQPQLLTIHLRSHSDGKPFPCSMCSKRFSREESLKAHMKSHNVSPPLVCPLCNQSFSQRADITEHLKTHFTSSEEQERPPSSQSQQEDGEGDVISNTTTPMVNGTAVNATVGLNGVHGEESSKGAVDLVVPSPQPNASGSSKSKPP
ncbi:zinc finger protein 423-like [Babylonia areolata]|uniref:zinc finger protein 423-like n=1 Tax=Babylonia areolata TaxID=304850 RepID=UPI003FD55779